MSKFDISNLDRDIHINGLLYNCRSMRPWGSDWQFKLLLKPHNPHPKVQLLPYPKYIRLIINQKTVDSNKDLKTLVEEYEQSRSS